MQHHLDLQLLADLCLAQVQVAAASSALRETSDRADVMAAHLKHVQARTHPASFGQHLQHAQGCEHLVYENCNR